MKNRIVFIVTATATVFIVILFIAIRRMDKNQSETIQSQDIESSGETISLQDSQQNNVSSFFYTDWDNMYKQNPYYVGQLRWASGLIDLPVIQNEAEWCMTHAFNIAESEYTVPFMTEDEYLHDHNLIIYAYNRKHNDKAKASVLNILSDPDTLKDNTEFSFYMADSYFIYEVEDVRFISEQDIETIKSSNTKQDTMTVLLSTKGEEDSFMAIVAEKVETVSYE